MVLWLVCGGFRIVGGIPAETPESGPVLSYRLRPLRRRVGTLLLLIGKESCR